MTSQIRHIPVLSDCLPAPAVGGWVTAQGHPRAIFERAIEHGNLLVAETTLRVEIPRPTLGDLLELTALIAQKQPERFSRVAARWLFKYLETVDDATIHDAAFVVANLQALGGRQHSHALRALREMTERRQKGSPAAHPVGWPGFRGEGTSNLILGGPGEAPLLVLCPTHDSIDRAAV